MLCLFFLLFLCLGSLMVVSVVCLAGAGLVWCCLAWFVLLLNVYLLINSLVSYIGSGISGAA